MVNKVATDYWIYGEYSDGFGKPLNAFILHQGGGGNDLHSLQKAGEPENFIWAKSELNLNFWFTEFLDCKNFHRDTNIQAKLAEQVFVQNNTLWIGLGFTPHQLVLGLSSGVPGIYDVPENANTNISRRIKAILNKSQVAQKQPHLTLGGSFPDPEGE